MTLYQLSSRACQLPSNLKLLNRQYDSGDVIVILEKVGADQLAALKLSLSSFSLYQLAPLNVGHANSETPNSIPMCFEILASDAWLALIKRADRIVTL